MIISLKRSLIELIILEIIVSPSTTILDLVIPPKRLPEPPASITPEILHFMRGTNIIRRRALIFFLYGKLTCRLLNQKLIIKLILDI
jgi:hypothetical protein